MKRLLVLILPFILLVSCDDDGSDPANFEYEESSHEILIVEEQNLLDVQNINGNIWITGSDTAHNIYLEITKKVKSYRSSSNASDHINDIIISFDSDGTYHRIVVDHPTNSALDYEVDLNIIAPIIFDYKTTLGNGNIELDVICRYLDMTLGNGNTIADVILLNDCIVNAETGNGNCTFIIPSVTSAGVVASIGNGNISYSGLEFENLETTGNSLSGQLGEGEGSINIFLGNGNLALTGY